MHIWTIEVVHWHLKRVTVILHVQQSAALNVGKDKAVVQLIAFRMMMMLIT